MPLQRRHGLAGLCSHLPGLYRARVSGDQSAFNENELLAVIRDLRVVEQRRRFAVDGSPEKAQLLDTEERLRRRILDPRVTDPPRQR